MARRKPQYTYETDIWTGKRKRRKQTGLRDVLAALLLLVVLGVLLPFISKFGVVPIVVIFVVVCLAVGFIKALFGGK